MTFSRFVVFTATLGIALAACSSAGSSEASLSEAPLPSANAPSTAPAATPAASAAMADAFAQRLCWHERDGMGRFRFLSTPGGTTYSDVSTALSLTLQPTWKSMQTEPTLASSSRAQAVSALIPTLVEMDQYLGNVASEVSDGSDSVTYNDMLDATVAYLVEQGKAFGVGKPPVEPEQLELRITQACGPFPQE